MSIERIKKLNPEILRAIVAKGLSDEKEELIRLWTYGGFTSKI